jgi:ActR/RegA family two-component response regulator
MLNKKKVLIIEDFHRLRISLHEMLEACGFEVYSAGTVADGRRLAEQLWGKLDVAVLDMRLDDPNERQTTGADIGIEFHNSRKMFPPETLIYSIYAEINYYRLALKLGAAAYLSKLEDDIDDVVRYVRVLSLRRALNGENPKTAIAITRIAAQSKSPSEAIEIFCRQVLKPEFEACLGAPFMILFTAEGETQNCANSADLPLGNHHFYDTLQALAHGKGNVTEPFVLEVNELETPLDRETALLYERLNNAAFLPLSLSNNWRLSIGILRERLQTEGEVASVNAKELCRVLAQYLRPTVLENIMSIWSQWAELRATRTSTAKLCLSVGNEIKDALETVELERLEALADDLNDTGQLLFELENRNWQTESEAVSVRDVIHSTWELIPHESDKAPFKPDVQGDCTVQAQRSDLEIIFSRMLQWFAHRCTQTPLGVEPLIRITCEMTADGATITFEDHSYRLPDKLRRDMFAPFTQAISTPFADIKSAAPAGGEADDKTGQRSLRSGRYLPLYLAQMLVEGRYHGLLADRSDEIQERHYGHRILMQLPATETTV